METADNYYLHLKYGIQFGKFANIIKHQKELNLRHNAYIKRMIRRNMTERIALVIRDLYRPQWKNLHKAEQRYP